MWEEKEGKWATEDNEKIRREILIENNNRNRRTRRVKKGQEREIKRERRWRKGEVEGNKVESE